MAAVWEKPGFPLSSCLTPGRKTTQPFMLTAQENVKPQPGCVCFLLLYLQGSLTFKDFSFLMGGGKGRRRERAREKGWDLKKESKTKGEGEISTNLEAQNKSKHFPEGNKTRREKSYRNELTFDPRPHLT